jgi:hypothetical protein
MTAAPPPMPGPHQAGYAFDQTQREHLANFVAVVEPRKRTRFHNITTGEGCRAEGINAALGSVRHRTHGSVQRRCFADEWIERFRSVSS